MFIFVMPWRCKQPLILFGGGGSPGSLTSSQDLRYDSLIEMAIRPGENITLHCDCKSSVGVYIVWYRKWGPKFK